MVIVNIIAFETLFLLRSILYTEYIYWNKLKNNQLQKDTVPNTDPVWCRMTLLVNIYYPTKIFNTEKIIYLWKLIHFWVYSVSKIMNMIIL